MRLYATLTLALSLGLASCNTTSTAINAIGSAAGAVPTISTDLGLACQSAQGLLTLPKTLNGSAAIQKTAASLSASVGKFCTKAISDAPTIQAGLQLVNTTAAVLLGLGVAL